jgi:RimJ/RimL family protein N-acetyltransferase
VLAKYQGLGYATEALRGLMEWIWEDERVASVCAQTFPALAGSVRVMEKCGMTIAPRSVQAGFAVRSVAVRELRLTAVSDVKRRSWMRWWRVW